MGITLTRKVGEKILIGEDIVIEVRLIRKNQVRICVDAPRDFKIHRPDYEPPDKESAG